MQTWLDRGERNLALEVLPEYGYQDNPPTDWLTRPIVEQVQEAVVNLDAWAQQATPEATEAYQYYVAVAVGLVSYGFWEPVWSYEVKRELLRNAYWLFRNMGTVPCLEKVLAIFGLVGALWVGSYSFTCADSAGNGSKVSGELTEEIYDKLTTGATLYGFLRLPRTTPRAGVEWKLANNVIRYFAPALLELVVCYQQFYADSSRVGEPAFL